MYIDHVGQCSMYNHSMLVCNFTDIADQHLSQSLSNIGSSINCGKDNFRETA